MLPQLPVVSAYMGWVYKSQTIGAVTAVCVLASIFSPFWAFMLYRWCFRFSSGILGAGCASLALTGPTATAFYFQDSAMGIYDVSGFVYLWLPFWFFLTAVMLLVFGLRSFNNGPVILWQPGMCTGCGYLMRGNVSGRCPECGCAEQQ
jgi:hypothetical protein